MAPKDEETPVDITVDTATTKKNDKDAKKSKQSNDDIVEDDNALSEEDKELKERLETCVSTLINENNEASVTVPIRLQALDVMVTELRSATSSMTSVPKPLKFLRPKFDLLKKYYGSIEGDNSDKELLFLRARLADVLSVLAMTLGKHGEYLPLYLLDPSVVQVLSAGISHRLIAEDRESLNFKLKGTKDFGALKQLGDTRASDDNLGSWGHEFVRSLAGEIGQEYNSRVIDGADPEKDEPFADLLGMVDVIVPFNVSHNAEAEAVDLLIEVQRLAKILDLDSIDENNYKRVCLYLIKTADYMSDPDDYAVRPAFSTRRSYILTKRVYCGIGGTRLGLPAVCQTGAIF